MPHMLQRIDADLFVSPIERTNSMVNEGLKMVRDRKMQEITAQRKQRNTLQFMMNC